MCAMTACNGMCYEISLHFVSQIGEVLTACNGL